MRKVLWLDMMRFAPRWSSNGFTLLSLLLAFAAGWANHGAYFGDYPVLVALACFGGVFVSLFAAVYTSEIKMGDPDAPPGQPCRHVAVGFLCLGPELLLVVWLHMALHEVHLQRIILFIWVVFHVFKAMIVFLNVRSKVLPLMGPTLYVWSSVFKALVSSDAVYEWSYLIAAWTVREFLVTATGFVLFCLFASACSYTRYLHDQRVFFVVFLLPALSGSMGFSSRGYGQTEASKAFPYIAMALLAIAVLFYCYVMMQRRERHFPPGLRGAKFVRLGFLRRMLSRGESIRRCQELSEEAFGDPRKALHLVVVSHRWFDRRTSDVCTTEHPQGLKLATMHQRLETYFGSMWYSSPSAWIIGGWDVLIFFDFMSLPQQGVNEQGQVEPRNPSDTAIFDKCLPLMGTLYSMFPVLVLTDMPDDEDCRGYHESGWCTCEFIIASLGKQLSELSPAALPSSDMETLLAAGLADFDSTVAQRFIHSALGIMERTIFTIESDRLVVLGIIRRFLVKRTAADYVRKRDVYETRALLSQLSDEDIHSILEEPVNPNLDTMLHLAVRAGDGRLCRELMNLGARADMRNINGDTPTQWYCFPRVSRAAAAVRAWGGSEAQVGFQTRRFTPVRVGSPTEDVFAI